MSWSRANPFILAGAILAGLLCGAIVAVPLWVADSRMVLEIRFVEAPDGSEPAFNLNYERGRGFHSLRVSEPLDGSTDDPRLYRWVFDARDIHSIRLGIAGWGGRLEVESAVLEDLAGSVVYEFDPARVRRGEGASAYPVEAADGSAYYRLILPVSQNGGVGRVHRLSPQSWIAIGWGFSLGAVVFWTSLQLCRRNPLGIGRIAEFRDSYPSCRTNHPPPRWICLASLGLLGFFVLIRSWSNFLHPSLFVEDAFHYFNHYYGAQVLFLDGLLRQPNDYLNLLPNLLAWSFAWLDVRFVPGAYVGFAVAFSLFAAVLPVQTGWFRSRWIAFVAPLVLGLSGLNHIFYYTTLTFQMYVAVLVLLVMMFLPEPKSVFRLLLRIFLGVFLVFSGPYSVVVVPVGLVLLVLYRPSRQSVFWSSMVLAGIAFLQTSSGLVRLQNVLEPSVLLRMGEVMIERVLFFGWGVVGLAPGAILAMAIVFASYVLLWKDGEFRRIGTVFLLIVVLAVVPLFLSQKFILYPDPYDCHILISQFFWLFYLLLAADRLAAKFGVRTSWKGPTLAALFVLFTAVDQRMNPDNGYFPPNPQVRSFVERVKAFEERLDGRNEFVRLEGEGAWQDAFAPRVRVGSMRADAQERRPEELELR